MPSRDRLADDGHALGAKREIGHIDAEDDDAPAHLPCPASRPPATPLAPSGASGARMTPFAKIKQP